MGLLHDPEMATGGGILESSASHFGTDLLARAQRVPSEACRRAIDSQPLVPAVLARCPRCEAEHLRSCPVSAGALTAANGAW